MQRLPGLLGPAPAMAAATGGLAPYDELLSSLNGLALLGGRAVQDLCQCSMGGGRGAPMYAMAYPDTHDL